MLRGMVFLDYLNFDISLTTYYRSIEEPKPRLDYVKLVRNVAAKIANVDFTKAFIFAPKPDEFLMQDEKMEKYYKWVTGMRSQKYIDVIEGAYRARPTNFYISMDINDKDSYYKIEKGTDINLALHALSKASHNAYDVAFVISADTDYISLYKELKSAGKIVILVVVKKQKFDKITPEIDDFLILDKDFFDTCIKDEGAKKQNRAVALTASP